MIHIFQELIFLLSPHVLFFKFPFSLLFLAGRVCVCLPLHSSPAPFSRIQTNNFLYLGPLFADVKGNLVPFQEMSNSITNFYVFEVLNFFNYWKLKYVPSSNKRYSKIKVSIKRQFRQIFFSLVRTPLPPHVFLLIIFSMMVSMLFFMKHCINQFFKQRLYSILF